MVDYKRPWIIFTLVITLLLLCSFRSVKAQEDKGKPKSSNEEEVVYLFAFSLSPPYIEDNINNRYWNFGGDSYLSVNEYIRLTQTKHSQRGWIWSKQPITAESWMVDIEFKIHGPSSLPGDGFAFWYTEEKEVEGKVFGSKDDFKGLGVFYDTYMNGPHTHAFPFISAMVGDGKTPYDHDNDGKNAEIASCIDSFRNKDWPTRTRIKYVKNRYLQVFLDTAGKDEWLPCFSVANVTLPTSGYLGLSSHTGDVFDNHDIIRISTSSLIHPFINETMEYEAYGLGYEKTNSGSGFGTFLTVLMIIGIILGVAYWYGNRSAVRYKRF